MTTTLLSTTPYSEAEAPFRDFINKIGLDVEVTFMPKAYKEDEKRPELNWNVRILHHGREVLKTEYHSGSGHCPGYKEYQKRRTIYDWKVVVWECNNGVPGRMQETLNRVMAKYPDLKKHAILPEFRGVMACLLMDAEAINFPTYESWADTFGFDKDSRKGEQTYKACLEVGLHLRQIGEDNMRQLRELLQDY